jgi:choline dehydrogenase-like flavoprotein
VTTSGKPDVDMLVVGSGPVGSTFAHVVSERLPDARILMVDAGPVLTDPPGLNLKNLDDEAAVRRAREQSEGPPQAPPGETDVPVIEGTTTARQGTHLVEPGSAGMPAAAMSTCVGGMGAHWTCATPRPWGSERIPFIPPDELDAALEGAERVLSVTSMAFAESPQGAAIRGALSSVFDSELPEGRKVGILAVAAREDEGGRVVWTGVDTILGRLRRDGSFELRAETLCRELAVDGGRVTGVLLEHRPSGERETVNARVVVVAADAFRTPQLLWASAIRPPALGRYLTEHPFAFGILVLDPGRVPPLREARERRLDPVLATLTVPYSEEHPFHAQLMHVERVPFPVPGLQDVDAPAGLCTFGWGFRKWPRVEDRVEFSDDRTDVFGMPAMSIHYELTDRELAEQQRALGNIDRAAAALGTFAPGGEPRVTPQGSSLHYMGTTRMGPEDSEETSVCDTWSRVWGFENLFVGGNGVIPTANTCNPTLTSVALAVRSCDRVVDALRR